MDKSSYGRRDRLILEREHDVYRTQAKLRDSTLCTTCGAVYMKGRWVWMESPEGPEQTTCPACRRTADNLPAGFIELRGNFFDEHREEILNQVRNVEEREKATHPMERIMDIEELPDVTVVTTTGMHVARGIGSALSSAYGGELNSRYLDGENCIKVRWYR